MKRIFFLYMNTFVRGYFLWSLNLVSQARITPETPFIAGPKFALFWRDLKKITLFITHLIQFRAQRNSHQKWLSTFLSLHLGCQKWIWDDTICNIIILDPMHLSLTPIGLKNHFGQEKDTLCMYSIPFFKDSKVYKIVITKILKTNDS